MHHLKLANSDIGLEMTVATVRQLTPRRYVDNSGAQEPCRKLPGTSGSSFSVVRATLPFHLQRRLEPHAPSLWRDACFSRLGPRDQPCCLRKKGSQTDRYFGGTYAVHEIQHSQIGRRCDFRHFELCLSAVRRTNGGKRQGVHVPG